jgi:complexin-1/2
VEQERLRQEAIKQAEKERREKYKKQEEDREHLRQGIREKVSVNLIFINSDGRRRT